MRKQSIKLIYALLLVIALIYLGGCGPVPFPFYDDFSDPSTKSKYRIFDERQDDSEQIVNGQLEITVTENQDLWEMPIGGGPPAKRGAPLVLINAPAGDYTAEALVTATNPDSPGGPQALNTQVGLFAFRDIENWLFYGFTNHDFTDIDDKKTEFDGLMVTVTHNGSSSIRHQYTIGNIDSAFLKLRKVEMPSGADHFDLWWRTSKSDTWIFFATAAFSPEHGTEEVGMGVKTFDLGVVVGDDEWVGLGLFDEFRVQVGIH